VRPVQAWEPRPDIVSGLEGSCTPLVSRSARLAVHSSALPDVNKTEFVLPPGSIGRSFVSRFHRRVGARKDPGHFPTARRTLCGMQACVPEYGVSCSAVRRVGRISHSTRVVAGQSPRVEQSRHDSIESVALHGLFLHTEGNSKESSDVETAIVASSHA
jgi:hypothetical protein